MVSQLKLDEYSLRERLVSISEEVDPQVADAARRGGLVSIVNKVVESENFEYIIRNFFEGSPYSQIIINTLLDYRGSKELEGRMMYDIERTLSQTKDFEAVKVVAETLGAYKGLNGIKEIAEVIERVVSWDLYAKTVTDVAKALKDEVVLKTVRAYQGSEELTSVIKKAIGETARWTRDLGAVRTVAEMFKEYNGSEGVEEIVDVIDKTASLIQDPEAVRAVAGMFKNYNGLEGVKEMADVMKNVICFDQYLYKTVIINTAKALGDNEVLDTIRAYQGLEGVKEISQFIGKIAYWTSNPKTFIGIAKAFRDKRVLGLIKDYQGSEELTDILDTIGTTAYWTRDPETVIIVAETLRAYTGSEKLKEIERDIMRTAEGTRYPEHVKDTARDYLNEVKGYNKKSFISNLLHFL